MINIWRPIAAATVAWLGFTGCATKKHVREAIAPVEVKQVPKVAADDRRATGDAAKAADERAAEASREAQDAMIAAIQAKNAKQQASEKADAPQWLAQAAIRAPEHSVGDKVDIRQVGRGFLLAGAAEPHGYGMYSYILFPSRPANDAQKQRYLSFLKAYLNLNDIQNLQRAILEKHELSLKQLHVAVVPLTRQIGSETAEDLLEAYDYVRSAFLIDNAAIKESPAMHVRGGPYLVCALDPLSETKPDSRLVQTLDWVPPGDLVNAWFQFFLSKAATPRDWDKKSLYQMALETQTWLENTGRTLPDVQKSVITSLVWFTGKSASSPGK